MGGSRLDEPIIDPVTGAYPRAHLESRLTAELARVTAAQGTFALFLYDVDFFKTVNDVYGHLRGDEVLRALTDRVKSLVRASDQVFRYGGDEFVLLLPDTGRSAALLLALRIAEEVRDREFPGEPPLCLSISIGVATCPDDGTDGQELLACADRRNYVAKRRGRGSAVADDADTGAASASSRLWERDAALAVTHEFLTRVQAEGRGALRVHGEPGAGHTRFLAEVSSIAGMRGFTVVPLPPAGTPPPTLPDSEDANVLLVADLDALAQAPDAVQRLLGGSRRPRVLGLVYGTTSRGPVAEDHGLPMIDTAELAPWSPAALRIWLRTSLQGEPSRTLQNWMAGRCGGLPARAVRELERLRAMQALVPTEGGGWTVAPGLLGRPRRRTRLPAAMTPLVGRGPESEQVVAMLAAARLVTLVGPGGVGKTRLALAVAGSVAEDYSDGAAFVELAEVNRTDLVVSAIARALRVGEVPGERLFDTLTDHLADASLLLVLDNFEQVVDAGGMIGELLAAAPGLSVLVTSRRRLDLYGEQVYQVPPLALPDLRGLPHGNPGVTRALASSPALALFDARARAVTADFALTPETLPVVVELCRLLDGLPLAIELAAARVDRWPPRELLTRVALHLDAIPGVGDLDVLGTGPRDRPVRQQTLRGAIDWSFALLERQEQRLFVTLAVFAGGCTLDAALAVTGSPDSPDAEVAPRLVHLVDQLTALTNKNLLVAELDRSEGPRYRMLETIRSYAAAMLAADPESDAIHGRHAAHFVGFAERSAAGMTGPEQGAWIERLDHEYPNLRAAMRWSLDRGEVSTAARVCLGLWRYWRNGSHIGEGRDWLSEVLEASPRLPDGARAQVLYPAAVLAAAQDDYEAARRFGRECLDLASATGDQHTAAQARNALGIVSIASGDYARASDHFRRSLAIWQDLDQAQGTAIALGNLTKLALRLGDIPAASGYADQTLKLERDAGNTRGIMLALHCLGQVRLAQADLLGAREVLRESLALSRGLGDVFGEAMALHQLGLAAQADGDPAEALRLLVAALSRRYEVGDREDLAVSLDCVANLTVESEPVFAVRLLAAADAVRARHRLIEPSESQTGREKTLALARAALDEAAFASAWDQGREDGLDMVVDQALDLASAVCGQRLV